MKPPIIDAGATDIGPLLQGIVVDFQSLLRQQVELVRLEMRSEMSSASQVVMGFAVGLTLATLAGLLLSFSAVHLISLWGDRIPLWGAYLVVGSALAVAAAILLTRSQSQARALCLRPTQTIETIKENAKWIQQHL